LDPEGFKRRSCISLAHSQIVVMRNGESDREGMQFDPSWTGGVSIVASMFNVMFTTAGGPLIERTYLNSF